MLPMVWATVLNELRCLDDTGVGVDLLKVNYKKFVIRDFCHFNSAGSNEQYLTNLRDIQFSYGDKKSTTNIINSWEIKILKFDVICVFTCTVKILYQKCVYLSDLYVYPYFSYLS